MKKEPLLIGTYLRVLRTRKKLTQQELSVKTGISQNCISELEANKHRPRWKHVQLLAGVLGVTEKAILFPPAVLHPPS